MKFRIGKGSTNAADSYVCVCEIFEVAPHETWAYSICGLKSCCSAQAIRNNSSWSSSSPVQFLCFPRRWLKCKVFQSTVMLPWLVAAASGCWSPWPFTNQLGPRLEWEQDGSGLRRWKIVCRRASWFYQMGWMYFASAIKKKIENRKSDHLSLE